MKKVLSVLLISTVLAFCASAMELNINLGVVSGAGVSHDAGPWQFGLDLESTFPVFSTFNAIMAQKYEDAEPKQTEQSSSKTRVPALRW